MRLGGWTRFWILGTILWAVPACILSYPYWEQNLTVPNVQRTYVQDMFDDLALAIGKAEGGRAESDVIDKAADTLLGSRGRTIAGFEELAKDPPTFVQRMKRVPFAAPENGMEIRYYVFPIGATDQEVAAALATESSRRQITEWARNEPLRIDLLMRNAASVPSRAASFELKTTELLADYHRAVEQLPKERFQFLLATLAYWLVPPMIVYILGWSVGWVVRGFRKPAQ
jgi:hypothetical protein